MQQPRISGFNINYFNSDREIPTIPVLPEPLPLLPPIYSFSNDAAPPYAPPLETPIETRPPQYRPKQANSQMFHNRIGSEAANEQPPQDYLSVSILTLIFCCLPFGIVALVFSLRVRDFVKHGHFADARKSSRNAKLFNTISFIIGFIVYLTTVIALATFFGITYGQKGNNYYNSYSAYYYRWG